MANTTDKSGLLSNSLCPTRRDFLKLSAASLAAISCGVAVPAAGAILSPQAATPKGREILAVGSSSIKAEKLGSFTTNNRPGPLRFLDVQSGERRTIELPFLAHIAIQNPARPNQFVAFEKWMTFGAMVDYNTSSIITSIKSLPDHVFYGHGAYNKIGTALFTCEDKPGVKTDKASGKIVLRDATTFQVIAQLPSFGSRPHECRTIEDGRTMIIVNEGRENLGNIAWIDMASGRLLNRVEYPAGTKYGPGHLAISHDNWICVGGPLPAEGSNKVVFISPEGKILPCIVPEEINQKMTAEALSIAFWGNTNFVAVTMPDSSLLMIFDAKTQKLVASHEGIINSGCVASLEETELPAFIISERGSRMLHLASMTEDGEIEMTDYNKHFGGNGSHLIRAFV